MYHVPRVLIASINPFCAACGDPIGEMTFDIYLKAVEARGPYLLCPDCRTRKCDVCGFLLPEEEMTPCYNEPHGFAGNACAVCLGDALPVYITREDFPAFFSYAPPNVILLRANEAGRPELLRAEEGERWER